VDTTPQALSPLALPRPNPTVVFRTVSDGAVLLHMEHEVYFGLNTVGSLVWQNLPPVCSDLESLCARLRESYPDVLPEVLRADVAALLAELLESELVVAAE
jgi:hypothetical protein